MWADGIYFNVRLDPDRPCMPVLMGTLEDSTKELMAVHDDFRESKDSRSTQRLPTGWLDLLSDLKKRGLKHGPELAVGDGALGFRAATPDFLGILDRRYHSGAHSDVVLGTLLSIVVDFGIPVFFCSDQQATCRFVEGFLHRYSRKECDVTSKLTCPRTCERSLNDGGIMRAQVGCSAESGWSGNARPDAFVFVYNELIPDVLCQT